MIKIPDMPAREHPLLTRFGMVSDEYKVAAIGTKQRQW